MILSIVTSFMAKNPPLPLVIHRLRCIIRPPVVRILFLLCLKIREARSPQILSIPPSLRMTRLNDLSLWLRLLPLVHHILFQIMRNRNLLRFMLSPTLRIIIPTMSLVAAVHSSILTRCKNVHLLMGKRILPPLILLLNSSAQAPRLRIILSKRKIILAKLFTQKINPKRPKPSSRPSLSTILPCARPTFH